MLICFLADGTLWCTLPEMTSPGHISRSRETRIRVRMWIIFAALMLPFCAVKGWQEYADRKWGRQSGYDATKTSSWAILRAVRPLIGFPADQVEARLTAAFPQLKLDSAPVSATGNSDSCYRRVLRDTKTGDTFHFYYRDGTYRYATARQSNPLLGTEPNHYAPVEYARQCIQLTSVACWGIVFLALLLVARLTKIRDAAVIQRLLVHLLSMAMLAVSITWALDPDPWGRYRRTDIHADQWIVLGLIAATLITVVFTYRRKKPLPLGFCPTCGYNLTGNISGICPECGTPVPEELRETLTGDAGSA